MNLQGQDWGEVVIRKKKPTAAQAQTEASVNAVWLPESKAAVNKVSKLVHLANPFSCRRGDQVQI